GKGGPAADGSCSPRLHSDHDAVAGLQPVDCLSELAMCGVQRLDHLVHGHVAVTAAGELAGLGGDLLMMRASALQGAQSQLEMTFSIHDFTSSQDLMYSYNESYRWGRRKIRSSCAM